MQRKDHGTYEEIIVGPGELYSPNIGSGDVLKNKLIDVSADRADVFIQPSGSGWEIRNIGIRGALDLGDSGNLLDSSYGGGQPQVFNINAGDGLIENVYCGYGAINGTDRTFMNAGTGHTGHLTIRNAYVGPFPTNTFYLAGFGREGTGGSVEIEDSYVTGGNVAHIRHAGNVTLRNTVLTNDNNVPVVQQTSNGSRKILASRGVWSNYSADSGPAVLHNCDIDITSSNTCQGYSRIYGSHPKEEPWSPNSCSATAIDADKTPVDLNNCNVRGSVGGSVSGSTGGTPNTSVPAGVPTSALEAAQGGQISCSGDGDCPAGMKCEGGVCVPIEPGDLPHGLKVKGNGTVTNYRICTTGPMVEDPNLGGFEQKHDGVEGQCVNGWVTNPEHEDGVAFDGTIDTVEWVKGEADLFVNGQQMSRQEALNWDPNAPKDDGPKEEPKKSAIGASGLIALGLAGAYLYNRYNSGGYRR